MMFRRFDRGLARLESGVAVGVLLTMVVVASLQALFFNVAERGFGWAQTALDSISWADTFLQKGTLWLAFLGASLATHEDKHIAIDVLPKFVNKATAARMRVFAAIGSGAIAFVLAYVFFKACLVADEAVPFDYEVLGSNGPIHVCDAGNLPTGGTSRPSVLCALRSALDAIGVPISSGAGIAQLIAPVMFCVIGIRLLFRGAALASALVRPPPADGTGDSTKVDTEADGGETEKPE